MWMPLSASRWILLLTLGVLMLLSAAHHSCCPKDRLTDIKVEIEDIEKCLKETSSKCGDAYWIKPRGGGWMCIHPKRQWLQELIRQGSIECSDRFDSAPIFEVLEEEQEKEEEE